MSAQRQQGRARKKSGQHVGAAGVSAWGGSRAQGRVQSWIPPLTVWETEYNAHSFQPESLHAWCYFQFAILFVNQILMFLRIYYSPMVLIKGDILDLKISFF